jgi:hypothetical protein
MAADWFDGNGTGGSIDLAELLDGQPMQGMREIAEHGALVSMGLTSDGGAFHLTVTMDGRYRREYFRDRDTLLAWIGEAILAVSDAAPPERPSAAQRGRSRRSRSA